MVDDDDMVEESFFDDDEFEDDVAGPATLSRSSGRAAGTWEGEGLRVELKRMKGVTRKGVLQTPFRFQCPPLETFRIETTVGATDYSTIQNGVYTRMGDRELTQIAFDTLVTVAPEPWVVYQQSSYDPTKVTQRLRNIQASKTAFRLVAWHPGPVVELNLPVTLRSVGVEERAGEGDAKYYSLSFTQWRDPIIRRRKRKRKFPVKHKLKKGDTLASLARKYYGSPSKGKQIKKYTPKLSNWGLNTPIVKHPKYKVGDTLVIRRPAGD